MKGTRPLSGPALTYDLCGQNVKVNVKINAVLTLTLNILTAFIRLGRAGPVGAGCPPKL